MGLSSMSATATKVHQELRVTQFLLMEKVVVIQFTKVVVVNTYDKSNDFCCKNGCKSAKLKDDCCSKTTV